MNFAGAVDVIKMGWKVRRRRWDDGLYVQLLGPIIRNAWFPLSLHMVIKTGDNEFVPWLATSADMLAEDWEVVEE